MAPCLSMHKTYGEADSGMRKLRKPVIEKMRRDRINSSIEQLRMLLEKELQRHQLPSKPEKADILEMTVTFLQQHLVGKTMITPNQVHGEGYCQCVQESVNSLSRYDGHQLMKQFHHAQFTSQDMSYAQLHSTQPSLSSKQLSHGQFLQNSNKNLWRPW